MLKHIKDSTSLSNHVQKSNEKINTHCVRVGYTLLKFFPKSNTKIVQYFLYFFIKTKSTI